MTKHIQDWTKEDYDEAFMLIEKCRREIRQWEIEQIKDFETFCKMLRSGGFSQFDFYGEDEREWDEYSRWAEQIEVTRGRR